MKIFVCEFVTGGGLYRDHLPHSLAQEGDMMLNAIVQGLLALPGVEVMTTRDIRLPSLPGVATSFVTPESDIWTLWEQCIAEADAVWPVAPESGGTLERLCSLVVARGKKLLASEPATIGLATSKFATNQHLGAVGIPVVRTFRLGSLEGLLDAPCVVKPDDGVSCEGTHIFSGLAELSNFLPPHAHSGSLIVQPLLTGIPASISMLCMHGEAWQLACNRQLIDRAGDGFRYQGSLLNAMQAYWTQFEVLAKRVAHAMPGLAGYIGVDVIVGEDDIHVLEVNPRLTTSYAGLAQATGRNPAGLILDMFYNDGFSSLPQIERNMVELRLNEQ